MWYCNNIELQFTSTFYVPYLMKVQLQGTWLWSLFLFSSNKIFVKMDYQVVFLWLDASESASQKHLTKILYFFCGISHLLCTPMFTNGTLWRGKEYHIFTVPFECTVCKLINAVLSQ